MGKMVKGVKERVRKMYSLHPRTRSSRYLRDSKHTAFLQTEYTLAISVSDHGISRYTGCPTMPHNRFDPTSI
jgi:hypothetical protein